MILTTLTNTLPMIETGIVCQIAAPALATVGEPAIQEFCFCEYECEYEEQVFALNGGTDFQNDKSAFARRRILSVDTIVFELWKNDVLLTTLTDATYGEFFDFGAFTTQPDVKAFRIEWEKVLNLQGSGRYQFKAVETIVGVVTIFESRLFRLRLYDLEDIDGTVRIETVQNGNINGGPASFDFKGMNWDNMFRLSGAVSGRKPTLVQDSYLNSKREHTQIQSSIINSYTLTTELIPRSVVNLLVFDSLLANTIFVTDYNLFSTNMITQGKSFEYNRIPMFPEKIGEPVEFSQSQKSLYEIDFLDAQELPLKRNF